MKIITEAKEFEKVFMQLLDKYENYFWITAWAGIGSKPYKKLIENQSKIKKIVVGLHFYQTHPEFIKTFLQNENVKFIKQPSGTFHPKTFLFFNSENDWNIIIGSANFTQAAFNINSEVSVLISNNDKNSKEVLNNTIKTVEKFWSHGKHFNDEELIDYTRFWNNFKPQLGSLSGNYSKHESNEKIKSKPLFQIPVAKMAWSEFVREIFNDKYHTFENRLKVLELVQNIFKENESFETIDLEKRKFIAGIPNNLPVENGIDWGFFGSMQGAGTFKKKIIENDKYIAKAINSIPISGQITKNHYLKFVENYQKAFEGNFLGTATRLLTMKRPDVFVCLNNKNRKLLCKAFGIAQSGMNYEKYWEDIILRIYDSDWWSRPEPKNRNEENICETRAAFLDSLYYIE